MTAPRMANPATTMTPTAQSMSHFGRAGVVAGTAGVNVTAPQCTPASRRASLREQTRDFELAPARLESGELPHDERVATGLRIAALRLDQSFSARRSSRASRRAFMRAFSTFG